MQKKVVRFVLDLDPRAHVGQELIETLYRENVSFRDRDPKR